VTLFDNGVQCLDFPPYSPDLNPIENLWNDLKRRVEEKKSTNLVELKKHIKEAWAETDIKFLQTVVDSMGKRCKAVKKHEGHMTKY
jgi:hypothetical protein